MNCLNDRYVNDSAICQAVAVPGQDQCEDQPEAVQSHLLPKILSRNTSFYMLGRTLSTVDAHNVLYPIMSNAG